MSDTRMIWVTKYALTKGIQHIEAEVHDRYAYGATRWRTQYPHGSWHENEADARIRAEEMRKAKIASLRKQIAKLEKLRFGGAK